MNATRSAIQTMQSVGYETKDIIDALCDGEVLAALGLGDEDQTDIENELSELKA